MGKFLATLLPRPRQVVSQPVGDVKSILVIRPGGIGDAVLMAAMVGGLGKTYPQATIDVLVETRNAGVFSLYPGIRSIYMYDHCKDLVAVMHQRYDVIIDTEQWHHLSAVVARLIRGRVRIGFGTNIRRRLFTFAIPYSHSAYEADGFVQLIRPLCEPQQFPPSSVSLQVPVVAEPKVAVFLQNLRSPAITFFPGASVAQRQWGEDNFRSLARVFSDNNFDVVIVGGKEDRDVAEDICAGRVLNLAGKTTLAETAAILKHTNVVVSGDSGILHLAVGLGVPTVSLFGPGIQEKWGPRGDNHIVINKRLPCSPCTKFGYTPKCPYDARCMKEITVDEVEAAVLELLRRIDRNKVVDTTESAQV